MTREREKQRKSENDSFNLVECSEKEPRDVPQENVEATGHRDNDDRQDSEDILRRREYCDQPKLLIAKRRKIVQSCPCDVTAYKKCACIDGKTDHTSETRSYYFQRNFVDNLDTGCRLRTYWRVSLCERLAVFISFFLSFLLRQNSVIFSKYPVNKKYDLHLAILFLCVS